MKLEVAKKEYVEVKVTAHFETGEFAQHLGIMRNGKLIAVQSDSWPRNPMEVVTYIGDYDPKLDVIEGVVFMQSGVKEVREILT